MKLMALFSFLFLASQSSQAAKSSDFLNDLENFRRESLTLQSEEQELEASSDVLLSKKLFWTPRIRLSATQTKTRVNGQDQGTPSTVEAEATLNLFRGGSGWNAYQSAEAQNKTQEFHLINEELRVEIKASDLIFKTLYLAESFQIQEELLKLKEESLRIVTDRYRQRKLPLQEVTKADLDLTQQKSKVRKAQLEISDNRSEIASAFVTEISTWSWPFNDVESPKLPQTMTYPVLDEKYWLQRSKEQDWRSSKGGHWPSLDLTVQYQKSPIETRTDDQLISLVRLSLPLWSQFETSARVSSSCAAYIRAQNEFKSQVQNLKQRIIFLKEKIQLARIDLQEAQRNLQKAKGLYQDVLKGFRLGRVSTNDLFLEQNRLLESQNSLALSQLSFHQTFVETCALAGLRSSECL